MNTELLNYCKWIELIQNHWIKITIWIRLMLIFNVNANLNWKKYYWLKIGKDCVLLHIDRHNQDKAEVVYHQIMRYKVPITYGEIGDMGIWWYFLECLVFNPLCLHLCFRLLHRLFVEYTLILSNLSIKKSSVTWVNVTSSNFKLRNYMLRNSKCCQL